MGSPLSGQLPLFRVGIPSDDDDLPLPVPRAPLQAIDERLLPSGHGVSREDEQVPLFATPDKPVRDNEAPVHSRLRTYLEVAEAVGLRRLQTLLELPASCFLFDPAPLQRHWYLRTLLEVRERILAHLRGAFDDLSRHLEPAVQDATAVLWGGTRRRQLASTGSPSPAITIMVGTDFDRALAPFACRVEGFRGFLGAVPGAPPLEVGAELLAIRHIGRLYHLLPVELQPVPLSAVLVG